MSKATLYHDYRDKSECLVSIADGQVSRLMEPCDSVGADVAPAERLSVLIDRFLSEYSDAQNLHRVLTEDVRFLNGSDRNRILDKERYVVRTFANAIAAIRLDLRRSAWKSRRRCCSSARATGCSRGSDPTAFNHVANASIARSLFLDGLHGPEVQGAKKKRRA